MVAPVFSASDFRSALLRLLPKGAIWSREAGGLSYQLSDVWAQTFARNSQRAINLLVDSFPATTTELLQEWQKTLGLPDLCAGDNPTLEQQRSQVVSRLTDSGGSSIAYYIAFAKGLGRDITITEFSSSRFGKKFGGKFGGEAWNHVWQVNVAAFTVARLKFGDVFGSAFSSWGNTVLQCELTSRKPAHTVLIFNYITTNAAGESGGGKS
ncbi:MAG: YmfQ family protein [Gluconobacter japonicus]|uniref:YmfQ family protein n=1 Tax=Gluconobacter japonicus TaxID=376620 RepID=UPI0039EBE8C3